ncbi:senescence/dehydration-associated protein-like isoform X1, chloroplastic [Iris pallida]|nr:senescence/dehydration-associated protein-like isoform X1, chloroplastic [Iris pallida]
MPDEKDIGDKQDEPNKKHGGINQSIRRVRKLSEMTEKMSESLLNGVIFVTGSATAPLLQSKAGKAFFGMLPGEVLLASLDAVGKVLDAVEVAERKTLAATGGAVAGAMSKNCRAGPDTGQPGRSSMAHEPGLATTQERLPSMRLQQQAMPLGQLGMYSKLGKPSNPLLQCHQRLLRMH